LSIRLHGVVFISARVHFYVEDGIPQSVQRRAGRPGFKYRQEEEIFSSKAHRPVLGSTQSRIEGVPEALTPGVKRLWSEVDHSTASSAEVKNGGVIPPFLHVFKASCLNN
jgi:hypothetical protein